MSLPAKDVYADPRLVRDPRTEARTLARILRMKASDVRPLLATTEDRHGVPIHFVYVRRGVDLSLAKRLQDEHLPGIGFLGDTRRYYPAGSLAPQVLGFVGVDGTGLAGLEKQYQGLLAGRAGHEVVQEDPSGTLIPQAGAVSTPPVPGDDLVLTIDRDIQYRAQQSLAAAVHRNHASGGTVIVMDPRTGDILAMATYPWFDPNRFAEANPDVLRSRAVTDVYEPGSVNKVITAAAAVQEGTVKMRERFVVPDQLKVYDATIHDAETHPTEQMTLADIISACPATSAPSRWPTRSANSGSTTTSPSSGSAARRAWGSRASPPASFPRSRRGPASASPRSRIGQGTRRDAAADGLACTRRSPTGASGSSRASSAGRWTRADDSRRRPRRRPGGSCRPRPPSS